MEAKFKDNNVLNCIQTFLHVHGSKELENLIEKKNEFHKDENFGLIWIITRLANQKESSLLGCGEKEEMLVRQWLEYACTHLSRLSDSLISDVHLILKELCEVLSDKVFFTGNALTLVDVVFYYMMHSTIKKLSLFEKEKYIHISRWFSHIQQNPHIRQSNLFLIFSRTVLYQ